METFPAGRAHARQHLRGRRVSRAAGAGLLALGLGLGGCSHRNGSEGTRRTWVIGLGWIDERSAPGVESRGYRVAGAVLGGQGLAVGYVRGHETEIDPQAAGDVVVSVGAAAGGGETVTVRRADDAEGAEGTAAGNTADASAAAEAQDFQP